MERKELRSLFWFTRRSHRGSFLLNGAIKTSNLLNRKLEALFLRDKEVYCKIHDLSSTQRFYMAAQMDILVDKPLVTTEPAEEQTRSVIGTETKASA